MLLKAQATQASRAPHSCAGGWGCKYLMFQVLIYRIRALGRHAVCSGQIKFDKWAQGGAFGLGKLVGNLSCAPPNAAESVVCVKSNLR
jgi:hypothetical protein